MNTTTVAHQLIDNPDVGQIEEGILAEALRATRQKTDKLMAILAICQWAFVVCMSATFTLKGLDFFGVAGAQRVALIAALAGLISGPTIYLALRQSAKLSTRLFIALGQGLYSTLLLQLMGSDSAALFHVFISLAVLSFYRDWRVLIFLTTFTFVEHLSRATFGFGMEASSIGLVPWHLVEHALWIAFVDVILLVGIFRGHNELSSFCAKQAELEVSNLNIEKTVSERTFQLAKARDEALRGAKVKSDFLVNMSHEIRTPMNGVLGYVQLLRESELSKEQRDYVDTIESCGHSLLGIINDILDFSKIESGKLSIEAVPFDAAHLMDEVSRLFAATASAQDLDFVCRTRELLGMQMIGDPTRIRQILYNLCGNAIKFTEHGHVQLDATIESRHEDRLAICFAVRDTGIGISEDRKADLFRPFQQADSSISRRFGGTGLGLTICLRLAELMGGTIDVESTEGQGSAFCLRIPLKLKVESQRFHDGLKESRYLIVDESDCHRENLEELLSGAGAQVSKFKSVADVLMQFDDTTAAQDRHFDGALIDLGAGLEEYPELVDKLVDLEIVNTENLIVMTPVDTPLPENLENREIGIRELKPIAGESILSRLMEQDLEIAKVATESQRRAELEAEEKRPSQILKVLVAEDNRVNQRLIKALLEQKGHDVTTANDGAEAIEAYEAGSFDLILMDAQMPHVDGLAATQTIRQSEKDQQCRTRIVALTAHAIEGYRERCLRVGMDDYITKPIEKHELDRVLDETGAQLINS